MAYIGKQPTVGNFVKLDAITTSATTTFNLTNGGVAYSPQSPNHCIVSLNGVIQSPTSAYTISGSTIVFSDALTSSDTIDFILVLGDVLNIGTPSDATVGFSKITSNLITGATAVTAPATDDVLLCYDTSATALRKITFANFGNTPAFLAYRTTNQSIASGSDVKVQLTSELFDTDNCFDSSTNYRFTPTTAGKYFLYGTAQYNTATDFEGASITIKKNGTDNIGHWNGRNEFYQSLNCSTIVVANGTTDYFEFFAQHDAGSNQDIVGLTNPRTFFMGYKLIGV